MKLSIYILREHAVQSGSLGHFRSSTLTGQQQGLKVSPALTEINDCGQSLNACQLAHVLRQIISEIEHASFKAKQV